MRYPPGCPSRSPTTVSPHRVPNPRAVASHSWRLARLIAGVLPLLLAACVTVAPPPSIGTDCEQGNGNACSQWGQQLLEQGEKQQAENAFARSCDKGYVDDCTTQGQLMLERGELAGAEAPLLKGYDDDNMQAAQALSSLYQSRGQPGDEERARKVAWDSLAIDKPPREFIAWWRPSSTGRFEYAFAYYFQPMLFWSRRMSLGFHFVGNDRGASEFNAAVSYQHFLTPEIVPYATLLMGGAFQNHSGNAGAEVGVKVCLGNIGHLNLGAGTSVGSPLHASVGIGINSLPVDILLYIAAQAH